MYRYSYHSLQCPDSWLTLTQLILTQLTAVAGACMQNKTWETQQCIMSWTTRLRPVGEEGTCRYCHSTKTASALAQHANVLKQKQKFSLDLRGSKSIGYFELQDRESWPKHVLARPTVISMLNVLCGIKFYSLSVCHFSQKALEQPSPLPSSVSKQLFTHCQA